MLNIFKHKTIYIYNHFAKLFFQYWTWNINFSIKKGFQDTLLTFQTHYFFAASIFFFFLLTTSRNKIGVPNLFRFDWLHWVVSFSPTYLSSRTIGLIKNSKNHTKASFNSEKNILLKMKMQKKKKIPKKTIESLTLQFSVLKTPEIGSREKSMPPSVEVSTGIHILVVLLENHEFQALFMTWRHNFRNFRKETVAVFTWNTRFSSCRRIESTSL